MIQPHSRRGFAFVNFLDAERRPCPAKEYVASQRADDPGVLILSCFAGAARELEGAVIVNPFDIEGMAEAILHGLEMPIGERMERWAAVMKVLDRNDITAWCKRFVALYRRSTLATIGADC